MKYKFLAENCMVREKKQQFCFFGDWFMSFCIRSIRIFQLSHILCMAFNSQTYSFVVLTLSEPMINRIDERNFTRLFILLFIFALRIRNLSSIRSWNAQTNRLSIRKLSFWPQGLNHGILTPYTYGTAKRTQIFN